MAQHWGSYQTQAQELLELHDEHGAAALEARNAPQLTWEQVRCQCQANGQVNAI